MSLGEFEAAKRALGLGTSLICVTTKTSALYGRPVKIYRDGKEVSIPLSFNSSGYVEIPTTASGALTVKTTTSAGAEVSARVDVDRYGTYYVNLNPATYHYCMRIDPTNGNPDLAVTYPSGYDNSNYTPARMVYNSGFDYGSWGNAFFMPKPCMLKYDGTVDYYLDPNDMTKKAGGGVSDVTNTSYEGNAMMEFPKIYKSVKANSDGTYDIHITDQPLDSTYHCWPYYNVNGKEMDHFYFAIYGGSAINNKLRSLSGQANSASKTREAEITLALANGDRWYTETLSDRDLINTLLVLMASTFNTQEAYGYGLAGGNAVSKSGLGDTRGMFYGTSANGIVKVFGIENYWGNQWRAVAGWVNDNGTQRIKLTPGTQDGSTATSYNLTGSGYLPVEGATPQGTSGGYISEYKMTPQGILIPYMAKGSATTYVCDGLYFANNQLDYAMCGGHYSNAALAGAFGVQLRYAASYTNALVGAALSYR